MNIELNRDYLQKLNIYQSSNGEYTLDRSATYKPIDKNDLNPIINLNDDSIPKVRSDYQKLNNNNYKIPIGLSYKGSIISPDILLGIGMNVAVNRLKYLNRHDVWRITGCKLPNSQLLVAIHYYIMNRIIKLKGKLQCDKYTKFMDESALIAIGTLIESYIEDLIHEQDGFKPYIEINKSISLKELRKLKRKDGSLSRLIKRRNEAQRLKMRLEPVAEDVAESPLKQYIMRRTSELRHRRKMINVVKQRAWRSDY
ncbi:hypothetical protein CANARDRAFT_204099 [[Candida] arabinofermentans NRRL YB-2248]|uniref:Uncharacterized protein n=1 Tax=[Candida] arabinofermentans NRRL YB-2248 TaxID=983967 RepID=A0A1E4STV5_9ASCO|nr:hypothetical protein CANARDRAFT_204099 [[Candida] arabinofermentans NRRL YB-2248]